MEQGRRQMNILLQWPRLYLRGVRVYVVVLGVFLSILRIMSLLLAIMVWLVDRSTVWSFHVRELYRRRGGI